MSSPHKTRVQVATDSSFSNIIVDTTGNYQTTLALASAELPIGSNLYIRGMHGHPDTGDSPWSVAHQFKVMLPYANQLYYTAGTFNFTVPAGVTSICIAMTPGVDFSTAGELLKTYIGRTTACAAGNNTVPVGISSITLSGKGADGSTTTTWNYSSQTGPTQIGSYPASVTTQTSITCGVKPKANTTTLNSETFSLISSNATTRVYSWSGYYEVSNAWGDEHGTWTITYFKPAPTNGANTTAVVNGTTYTFPGGVGGAASTTNHTVAINPATGANISATIPAGGTLSYSYSAYAISALGTLLGNNFSLSPVAANVGTYSGGIAAWRNNIAVTPGATIPVRVGTGGAVNVIWGTGRTFPNSEV